MIIFSMTVINTKQQFYDLYNGNKCINNNITSKLLGSR